MNRQQSWRTLISLLFERSDTHGLSVPTVFYETINIQHKYQAKKGDRYMQIHTIPGDFIINPVFQWAWRLHSDFVLKALRIINDSEESIRLESISFGIKASGQLIKDIVYQGSALENLVKCFPKKVKDLSDWDSKIALGTEKFWNTGKLADSVVLEPGQETGIGNEFFLVVFEIPADELVISVCYAQGAQSRMAQVKLPLIQYQSRNQYIFPVKGVWQINGNFDCISAHRTQYSMEFAMDMCQMNSDCLITYKPDMKNEDYIHYGKDILAIADGEVMDCFNDCQIRENFPYDTETDENLLSERKKFVETYGRLPVQCGNYVVIRHDHEEYSFYGHLKYQSVAVKKGVHVKQGQPIGQIGNTGRSGCPHLHFQLMNGPDFSTARGLPCHFSNILDINSNPLSLIQEEYTIIQAK
jgi:hypothetical protein